MLLFAEAGAGQLVETKIEGLDQAPFLTAYGLRSDGGGVKALIFNKNLDRRVRLSVNVGQAVQRAGVLRLHAPRVDDTTDVTIGGAPIGADGAWSAASQGILPAQNGSVMVDLPAASAALLSFE